MRVRDFDFENVLLHEKSCENSYDNILIYDIHTKLLWVQNHCLLGSIK